MTVFVESLRDDSTVGDPQIALVVSEFYSDIAENLVLGAKNALSKEGFAPSLIYPVAGALEIPLAIQLIQEHNQGFDGYIALGCVIRGETYHFEIVATQSAQALLHLALQPDFPPIVNGILTVDTLEQARIRSRISEENDDRGGRAVRALIPLLRLRE